MHASLQYVAVAYIFDYHLKNTRMCLTRVNTWVEEFMSMSLIDMANASEVHKYMVDHQA